MGCQADAGDPCNTGKRGFLKRLSGAGAISHPHPFDKPIPGVGPIDAPMRIATTAICSTDIHVLKGRYPVAKGLAACRKWRSNRDKRTVQSKPDCEYD